MNKVAEIIALRLLRPSPAVPPRQLPPLLPLAYMHHCLSVAYITWFAGKHSLEVAPTTLDVMYMYVLADSENNNIKHILG